MSGLAVQTSGDRAVSAAGPLPAFLIIGAMKAGTTTLHQYLRRHPRLFLCEPKEPQFFSRDENYGRGEAWYRSLFEGAGHARLAGEASTCYSRWPHHGDVPGRIAAMLPDVRLVYLMRHPVDRCYSHYSHAMRFEVTMSFEEALEADPEIIDASMYLRQVGRFLEHFPRERLFLATLDDLNREPGRLLDDLQRFLGVERADLAAAGPIRANATGSPLAKKRVHQDLSRVRRIPLLGRAVAALPEGLRRGVRARVEERLRSGWYGRRLARSHAARLAPMSADTRRRLLDRFREPTRELEAFLGRPLERWFV